MRQPFFFAILITVGISLSLCSQPSSNNVDPTGPLSSIIDTSTIAIIPFDQEGNWPFHNSYQPASVTPEEIKELDSLLNFCIQEYNDGLSDTLKTSYAIDLKRVSYKRQYVLAINPKGEKEVWVNCFCSSGDNKWKKEILLVKDGGNCYFNLKVNLKTKKCFELSVNDYV